MIIEMKSCYVVDRISAFYFSMELRNSKVITISYLSIFLFIFFFIYLLIYLTNNLDIYIFLYIYPFFYCKSYISLYFPSTIHRWNSGPKVRGQIPIVVMFTDKKYKDQVSFRCKAL